MVGRTGTGRPSRHPRVGRRIAGQQRRVLRTSLRSRSITGLGQNVLATLIHQIARYRFKNQLSRFVRSQRQFDGDAQAQVCVAGHGPPADFQSDIIANTDQLRRVFSTTADQYELRSYPGRAALFILSERDGMSDSLFDPALGDIDPQLGWGRVVAGGVEVYEVPGEHVSIFREPNVRSLAEKLTNCLEMARETALK
jgi:hypothetical protein